jgi:hypothetical protein
MGLRTPGSAIKILMPFAQRFFVSVARALELRPAIGADEKHRHMAYLLEALPTNLRGFPVLHATAIGASPSVDA